LEAVTRLNSNPQIIRFSPADPASVSAGNRHQIRCFDQNGWPPRVTFIDDWISECRWIKKYNGFSRSTEALTIDKTRDRDNGHEVSVIHYA